MEKAISSMQTIHYSAKSTQLQGHNIVGPHFESLHLNNTLGLKIKIVSEWSEPNTAELTTGILSARKNRGIWATIEEP